MDEHVAGRRGAVATHPPVSEVHTRATTTTATTTRTMAATPSFTTTIARSPSAGGTLPSSTTPSSVTSVASKDAFSPKSAAVALSSLYRHATELIETNKKNDPHHNHNHQSHHPKKDRIGSFQQRLNDATCMQESPRNGNGALLRSPAPFPPTTPLSKSQAIAHRHTPRAKASASSLSNARSTDHPRPGTTTTQVLRYHPYAKERLAPTHPGRPLNSNQQNTTPSPSGLYGHRRIQQPPSQMTTRNTWHHRPLTGTNNNVGGNNNNNNNIATAHTGAPLPLHPPTPTTAAEMTTASRWDSTYGNRKQGATASVVSATVSSSAHNTFGRRRPAATHPTFVTPPPKKKLKLLDLAPKSSCSSSGGGSGSSSSSSNHKFTKVGAGVGKPTTIAAPYSSQQQQQPQQTTAVPSSSSSRLPYSRKKKSLGVLANNFLNKFEGSTPGTEVIVDEAAVELGVERRRIYDVVNILESIQLVVKKGKNTYTWLGKGCLPRVFGKLQEKAFLDYPHDAIKNHLITTQGVLAAKKSVPAPPPSTTTTTLLPHETQTYTQPNNHNIVEEYSSLKSSSSSSSSSSAKDNKSLANLSQQFLEVFLVGHDILSLPQASDKIQGATSDEDLAALGSGASSSARAASHIPSDPKEFRAAAARGLKTKIRRLYDIANVFLSVGLLRKIDAGGGKINSTSTSRRPNFQWAYHLSPLQIKERYLHGHHTHPPPGTSQRKSAVPVPVPLEPCRSHTTHTSKISTENTTTTTAPVVSSQIMVCAKQLPQRQRPRPPLPALHRAVVAGGQRTPLREIQENGQESSHELHTKNPQVTPPPPTAIVTHNSARVFTSSSSNSSSCSDAIMLRKGAPENKNTSSCVILANIHQSGGAWDDTHPHPEPALSSTTVPDTPSLTRAVTLPKTNPPLYI